MSCDLIISIHPSIHLCMLIKYVIGGYVNTRTLDKKYYRTKCLHKKQERKTTTFYNWQWNIVIKRKLDVTHASLPTFLECVAAIKNKMCSYLRHSGREGFSRSSSTPKKNHGTPIKKWNKIKTFDTLYIHNYCNTIKRDVICRHM